MKTKSLFRLTIVITILSIGIGIISCEKDSEPIVAHKEHSYKSTGKPKNILSLNKAVKYYKNYDTRAKIIQSREKQFKGDFLATRMVTFDYQEMVNYFRYIEEYAEKAGVEVSGLRFYYGQYPFDGSKYEGQQVLFFNPTVDVPMDNGEVKKLAYAIDESGNETKIKFLKDIIDREGKIMKNQKASFISMVEQGGQHSPPPPGHPGFN